VTTLCVSLRIYDPLWPYAVGMEEGDRRDNGRAAAASREVAPPVRRIGVSGETRIPVSGPFVESFISCSSVVMRVSVFNDMLICPLTISKFPLLVTLLALLILLLYLFLSWNYVVSEYVK
jgi:hypothetical protein